MISKPVSASFELLNLMYSEVFCIDHYISALCMLFTGNVFLVVQEVCHLTFLVALYLEMHGSTNHTE